MAFVRVAAMNDLWSGEMKGYVVEASKVLLVKMDETVYAYEDRCAHLGLQLSQGSLEGNVLTCYAHHWQYNVCTGQGVNPQAARLSPLSVKIEQGDIFVDLDKRSS
jgi:toluene monooxygenase system ferredoxin subunit